MEPKRAVQHRRAVQHKRKTKRQRVPQVLQIPMCRLRLLQVLEFLIAEFSLKKKETIIVPFHAKTLFSCFLDRFIRCSAKKNPETILMDLSAILGS